MPMHVCQSAVDAVVIVGEGFVVDAQKVEDRGVEVGPRHRIFDGAPANRVGLAVGDALA